MMEIEGSGSADPDPLVRGMDPRIRNRIHTKMSWIRNTAGSWIRNRKFWLRDNIPDPQHLRVSKEKEHTNGTPMFVYQAPLTK